MIIGAAKYEIAFKQSARYSNIQNRAFYRDGFCHPGAGSRDKPCRNVDLSVTYVGRLCTDYSVQVGLFHSIIIDQDKFTHAQMGEFLDDN
jgi:hypothetical protein